MLLCPPLFFATLFAQHTAHQCHAHENLTQQLTADPSLKDRLDAHERFTNAFASRVQLRGGQQVTIPVVVHLVSASVTDAQVLSQIEALNRDFNKLNTDATKIPSEFTPLTADCEIKFQLAARTPDNEPTNGILRHTSSRTEWGGQDDVKKPSKGGFAPWNASKYLNIYVCSIGNGVLGYASFPGTPAEVDGLVIDPTAFGTVGTARRPFNMGRTCVHEVAHWLNLYHIWGDSDCGDDRCSDTPTQKEAHYGDPKATYSTCSGTQTRDMSMNFMDYVNDASMVMFSNGQKTRMQATLSGVRASILTSDGCVPPVQIGCKVKNILVSELKTTAATLAWHTISGTKTYTIDIRKTGTTHWLSTTTNDPTYTFSNLTPNEFYEIRVKSDCLTAEFSEAVNFTTRLATKGMDDYESNNSKADAKEIKANGTIAALIGDERDVDWFSVKTTAGQPNLNITLSTLAADYDFRVYDANGKILKVARIQGLDNESVSINSTVAATYFIQVYGYNKVFDAYSNYTLTTTTSAQNFAIDEAFEYYNKAARMVEEDAFQIYPNPVVVDATFYFDAKKEGAVTLQIADLRGVVCVKTTQNIGKTTPAVSVDLSALPRGIYIATVEQGGQIKSKKLVKN